MQHAGMGPAGGLALYSAWCSRKQSARRCSEENSRLVHTLSLRSRCTLTEPTVSTLCLHCALAVLSLRSRCALAVSTLVCTAVALCALHYSTSWHMLLGAPMIDHIQRVVKRGSPLWLIVVACRSVWGRAAVRRSPNVLSSLLWSTCSAGLCSD